MTNQFKYVKKCESCQEVFIFLCPYVELSEKRLYDFADEVVAHRKQCKINKGLNEAGKYFLGVQ